VSVVRRIETDEGLNWRRLWLIWLLIFGGAFSMVHRFQMPTGARCRGQSYCQKLVTQVSESVRKIREG
jgi:hypothetical protein